MNSFLSSDELQSIGLKYYGENVKISKYARFYNPSEILIGDNVRIDDFCILSGNIQIGSNIHISAYCALYGAKGIILENFTGLSPRVTIFSAMDDFSGNFLIGPVHDKHKTHVVGGTVLLQSYTQVGAGSIIFPDITIGEGSVVGAMSLVNNSLDKWGIYAGIPVKKIKNRSDKLLELL